MKTRGHRVWFVSFVRVRNHGALAYSVLLDEIVMELLNGFDLRQRSPRLKGSCYLRAGRMST